MVAEVTDGGPWFAGGSGTARRIDSWLQNRAWSQHPGGGNVVFADGSVQFLSATTDVQSLRSLATARGGEATSVAVAWTDASSAPAWDEQRGEQAVQRRRQPSLPHHSRFMLIAWRVANGDVSRAATERVCPCASRWKRVRRRWFRSAVMAVRANSSSDSRTGPWCTPCAGSWCRQPCWRRGCCVGRRRFGARRHSWWAWHCRSDWPG